MPAGLDADGRRAWLVEHAVYGPADEAMDAIECADLLARAGDDVLLEHLVAQATRCDAGFCLALEVAYATLLAERTEAFVTVLAKRNTPWRPTAPPGELSRIASFLGLACRRRESQGLPLRDPELAKRLAAMAQPEWSDEARIVAEISRTCEQFSPRNAWVLETGLTFRTLLRRKHAIDVEKALATADMRALVPALEAHLTDDTPDNERLAAAYVLAARGHRYEEMRERLIAELPRKHGSQSLNAFECLGELARRGDTSLVPRLVREAADCDAGFCLSSIGILSSLLREHTTVLTAALIQLQGPEVTKVLRLVGEGCWLRERHRGGDRLDAKTLAKLRSIQSSDEPGHARTAAALERACSSWAPPQR